MNEATTILQPSLYTVAEFTQVIVDEAESYGANPETVRLWREYLEIEPNDPHMDVYFEVIDELFDLGYEVDTEYDSFIVRKQ